jgi:hypothetical protein
MKFSLCKPQRQNLCSLVVTTPGDRLYDVDYTVTVIDVYTRFTLFMIEKDKSLKILGARKDPMQRT